MSLNNISIEQLFHYNNLQASQILKSTILELKILIRMHIVNVSLSIRKNPINKRCFQARVCRTIIDGFTTHNLQARENVKKTITSGIICPQTSLKDNINEELCTSCAKDAKCIL